MTKLKPVKLRFDAGSKQERIDGFRAATPLDVAFPSDPAEDFFARIDAWSVADIDFREYDVAPFMTGYNMKQDSDYGCMLTLTETGRVKIWDGARIYHLEPGCVHFNATGCMSVRTHVTGKIVYLPADVMELSQFAINRIMKYNADSVSAKILSASIRSAFESLTGAEADQAREIERTFVGLIKTFFFDQRPNEEVLGKVRAAQKRAIIELVDQRCADPDFKVADVLRSFHVSRATLGRMFEQEGGAAAYIVNRRLEHALNALTTVPAERGRIIKVSEDVGFLDYGHFRRAFRRRFGFPPSDALALAPPADQA